MSASSEPIIIAAEGQAAEMEATFGDRYQQVNSGLNPLGTYSIASRGQFPALCAQGPDSRQVHNREIASHACPVLITEFLLEKVKHLF